MKKIIIVLFILCYSGFSFSKEKPELKIIATEIVDGLYMLSGVGGFTGGNVGLSVGDDGVILIDDAMPSTLNLLQEAIKGITTKEIDFLINTHVHGDHTGNNETFGNQGAHIIAHENLRKYLLNKGVKKENGNKDTPKKALPVITFANSIDFHLNGNDAHIFHLPHAHTDGDAAIHFTNINVIHMGDTLFNRIFPYIDLTGGGSLDGYIEAQKTVLGLVDENTKIIPGHGVLANKKDLQNSIAMLEDARTMISELIAAGKTEEQIVALNPLQEKYANWAWGFITLEKMTQQIYRGITTTAL